MGSVTNPGTVVTSVTSLSSNRSQYLVPRVLNTSSSYVLFAAPSEVSSVTTHILATTEKIGVSLSFTRRVPLRNSRLRGCQRGRHRRNREQTTRRTFTLLRRRQSRNSRDSSSSSRRSGKNGADRDGTGHLRRRRVGDTTTLRGFC